MPKSNCSVVTMMDIVVELHDHGGWNFTEIAEYIGKYEAKYFSSEYRKFCNGNRRKKHTNTKIVFDLLKTQGGEGLTQKQLAETTGLDRVKVCQAVSKLIEWYMVTEKTVRIKPTEEHRRYYKVLVSAV